MSTKIGAGTTLTHCATSGGSYVAIAKITAHKPPTVKVEKVEVDAFDNTLDSTSGLPVSDNIPGWMDPGEHDFSFFFDKTQFSTLKALVGINPHFFKITFPDGSGYGPFQGWISEMTNVVPMKQAMTADVKVILNGAAIAAFNTTQS